MAGSVTILSDETFPKSFIHTGEHYKAVREVVFTCTGDASDGTVPTTNLCAFDSSDGLVTPLSGWGIWAIETKPGTTAPTDATDLYLKTAWATDLLDGEGVDKIDATSTLLVYPPQSMILIGGTLSMVIANQAVHSAVFYVKLYLVR